MANGIGSDDLLSARVLVTDAQDEATVDPPCRGVLRGRLNYGDEHKVEVPVSDIEVVYRTKPSDITPRKGVLRLDETGIGWWRGGKKRRMHYPWDTIRRVAFDDPGRTKANAGVIAMFGLAGMAGRKSFTYVIVGTDSGDVIFEADRPISAWKSMAQQLITDVPQLTGKLYIEGDLVGRAAAVIDDLSTQIARLAGLHAAGTLSDEEFSQAKQRLLAEPS